jgi:hypothetical protein
MTRGPRRHLRLSENKRAAGKADGPQCSDNRGCPYACFSFIEAAYFGLKDR